MPIAFDSKSAERVASTVRWVEQFATGKRPRQPHGKVNYPYPLRIGKLKTALTEFGNATVTETDLAGSESGLEYEIADFVGFSGDVGKKVICVWIDHYYVPVALEC